MNLVDLRKALEGLPVPDICYFDETGSTNEDALAWAEAGAQDACLVVADLQKRGRGRMGRRWVTEPGAALAFSLILRPRPDDLAAVGFYSPLAGLGVALALEEMAGVQPEIKWPNDVLLGRKKMCGVLAESFWMGERLGAVVLGIGVNIASSSVPPANQVMFPATSLEDYSGKRVDRLALLRKILEKILDWRAGVGSAEFIQAWQTRLAFRNEQVAVSQLDGNQVKGLLRGVDASGGLLLELSDSQFMTVMAGDVSLRPEN